MYNRPFRFSGQAGATELIVEGLRGRDWFCRILCFPVLNRASSTRFGHVALHAIEVLAASVRLIRIVFTRRVVLYLNLGQSLASFLRIGPALIAISMLRPRLPRVISLHGSVFMTWHPKQIQARIFRFLLRRADLVTVLGAEQRRRLGVLGVERARVTVLPNTCELPACSDTELKQKSDAIRQRNPLRILHLSLLIESKGFPEFLEALELLGERAAGPIEAVLCGPPCVTPYCRRFTTLNAKSAWIREKMQAINLSPSVRVRWIQGAAGEAKHSLLRDAGIFVFPSRYPVEAQPLALLEAMASGCTIVTSTVGEIPSTLDERSAVLLSEPTPTNVAAAIQDLMARPDQAAQLARNARDRYAAQFDQRRYADRWAALFSSLYSPQSGRGQRRRNGD